MRHTLLCTALLAVACAGITVEPATSPKNCERGIRYYDLSTYILVHTDNQGGLVTKVLMLPDPKKKMSLRPYAVMASAKTTFDFQNGSLSKAATTVDTTAVPVAIIKAAEKVAAAAAKAMAFNAESAKPTQNGPPPYIFKLVYDKKTKKWLLKGGIAKGADGQRDTIEVAPPAGS